MSAYALLGIVAIGYLPFVRRRLVPKHNDFLFLLFALSMALDSLHLQVGAIIVLVFAWAALGYLTRKTPPQEEEPRTPRFFILLLGAILLSISTVAHAMVMTSPFALIADMTALAIIVIYGLLPALRARRLAR